MPWNVVDRFEQRREVAGRVVRGLVVIHDLPEELHLPQAAAAASRTSARISAFGRIRSWPRVYGTTQKLQYSLQPSMMVTQARTGSSRRVRPNGKGDVVVRAEVELRAAACAAACSTSIGSIRARRVPTTTSTIAER